MKASETQGLCKKLVTVLKKHYKTPPPDTDRPVIDLLLFAICLENVSAEEAEETFQRLLDEFHDYNEMRVSSLTELEAVFENFDAPEYRAVRVRTVLHDLFEKYYSFDFDILKKKTLETAAKQLQQLRHLSDFVRDYTLQNALEAHFVPMDDRMRDAAAWLGLVSPETDPHEAGESLKPAIRKADAPKFCHLLRCLATDDAFVKTFESVHKKTPEQGFDPGTAVARLEDLFKSGGKGSRNRKTAKSASRKSGGKGKAAKKKTKRTARSRK